MQLRAIRFVKCCVLVLALSATACQEQPVAKAAGCSPGLEAVPGPAIQEFTGQSVPWADAQHALIGVFNRSKTLVNSDASLASIYLRVAQTMDDVDRTQRIGVFPGGQAASWQFRSDHPGLPMPTLTTQALGLPWTITAFAAEMGGEPVDWLHLQVENPGSAEIAVQFQVKTTLQAGHVQAQGQTLVAGAWLLAAVAPTEGWTVAAQGESLLVATKVPAQSKRLIWLAFPRRMQASAFPQTFPDGAAAQASVAPAWQAVYGQSAQLTLPDPWLQQAWQASLTNLLLLRDKVDSWYIVKPGAFNYNRFWYRDAAYIVHALDAAGLPQLAEESLQVFWRSDVPCAVNQTAAWAPSVAQMADGMWTAPSDEWDGPGQALWALVSHWRFTGNTKWLQDAWPAIRKGTEHIAASRQAAKAVEQGAEIGLLPLGVGEALIDRAHVLYHNYWSAFGVAQATQAAVALGHNDDAARYLNEYADFAGVIQAAAAAAYVAKDATHGWIPAAVGAPTSRLWGTIAALYPPTILPADDPHLVATLETLWQNRVWDLYRFEDVDKVWTYITADWGLALQRQGQWQREATLFAGYRAQASQVFSWWEEIYVQSGVGTGDNPHGWAAANYMLWLRNMLVMEDMDGQGLQLLAGVPPAWYVAEKPIELKNLPTELGLLTHLRVDTSPSGQRTVQVTWADDGQPPPKWALLGRGLTAMSATCDVASKIQGDAVLVEARQATCVLAGE